MDTRNQIKSYIVREGMTMADLVEKLRMYWEWLSYLPPALPDNIISQRVSQLHGLPVAQQTKLFVLQSIRNNDAPNGEHSTPSRLGFHGNGTIIKDGRAKDGGVLSQT